jgi:tRNA(Ile)-lysidine synthase
MYTALSHEVLPRLLPPGERILVAVSGGPDSLALAHVIRRWYGEGKSLVIAHIDHSTRPETKAEAAMVREFGASLGVRVAIHSFDAKTYARNEGKGFQEAAREWRYARLREDMEAYGCTYLATAHHLDDQAETLLLRLLRGSGSDGLAGMSERSGIYLKPFLSVTKADILKYCESEGINYATDASNFRAVYMRNRVRLELLPLLKEQYNPRLVEALGRTALILQRDRAYLDEQANSKWELYALPSADGEAALTREAWREPPAILSRLLRRAFSEATGQEHPPDFRAIETLRQQGAQPGWQKSLPSVTAWTDTEALHLRSQKAGVQSAAEMLNSLCPNLGAEAKKILARWLENSSGNDMCEYLPREMWLSLPQGEVGVWSSSKPKAEFGVEICSPLVELGELCWRHRRAGDVVYLPGLGHKSLKKVWQERKIPVPWRDAWPLLAVESLVLWVPGLYPLHEITRGEPNVYCAFR